jgi:hypothetical protein
MVNGGNNKAKIIYESILVSLRTKLSGTGSKLLTLSSTLFAFYFIFGWILYPSNVNGGPYLDSAHGDTTYGVLRSSLSVAPNNYGRGNCAHCHEQHASIGGVEPDPVNGAPSNYLLFRPLFADQGDAFCYGCHKDPGTSNQSSMINQYLYSYTAGGDTTINCPDDIKEAFQFVNNSGNSQLNCGSSAGSSHFLDNIKTFLTGKGWGYVKFSICSGCHNPHRAQKDPHTSSGRIVGGKLVSAVSRPSQHTDLTTWELWGDDSSERMNVYSSNNYLAPKRRDIGYEPDGSLTQDGSNMVDFVTLCTDCHNGTNTINSTILGRNLYRINWGAGGDFHGGRQRIDGDGDFSGPIEFGDLIDPYKVGVTYSRTNYILSCTDCHEPHGSPNELLMRQTVNGTQVSAFGSSGRWYNYCQTCHSTSGHLPPLDSSTNCFQSGACHRHCDPCSSNNLF